MEKIWIILAILAFIFEILGKKKKIEEKADNESKESKINFPRREQSLGYEEQRPHPYIVTLPFPADVYKTEEEDEEQYAAEPLAEEAVAQEPVTEEQLPRHIQITAPVEANTSVPKPSFVLNPASARDAIIWMEVLGPPKGLQRPI